MRHFLLPAMIFLAGSLGACSGLPGPESGETDPPGAVPPIELVEGERGILVVVPENAAPVAWELWQGEEQLDDYQDSGVLLAAEPGIYSVRKYFNSQFVWASEVPVENGKTTRVQLGAVEIATPEETGDETFDLWIEGGEAPLDQANDCNQVVPVPAGRFVVKKYFNPDFIWKSPLVVEAGQVTRVELGGIRLTSDTVSQFDLYEASTDQRLSLANSSGRAYPVPAGSYTLKKYFSEEVVARNVQVTAGMVSEVEN